MRNMVEEKVIHICNEMRNQVDDKQNELLKQIAGSMNSSKGIIRNATWWLINFLGHASERELLLSEITKLNQFELSARGAKLMSQSEFLQCHLSIPKVL